MSEEFESEISSTYTEEKDGDISEEEEDNQRLSHAMKLCTVMVF